MVAVQAVSSEPVSGAWPIWKHQRAPVNGKAISIRARAFSPRKPVTLPHYNRAREALVSGALMAAFFEGEKPKEREGKRGEYASAVVSGEAERYRGSLEEWRHAEQPLSPFHWEIEFPEVFERESPGFDAMVGNPPFAGKNTVAAANVGGTPTG